MAVRTTLCVVCEATISIERGGPLPRYCSELCRKPHQRMLNRERMRKAREDRPTVVTLSCTECGETFTRSVRGRRTVCGNRCRNRRGRRAYARHHPDRLAAQRRSYRLRHPEKFKWNEAKKAAYHRRRARKRGAVAETIRPAAVFARDGWLCGICQEPVDPDLRWPDARSASLDHIKPLARGGSHTLSNVQLAHLSCNVAKRDRLPGSPTPRATMVLEGGRDGRTTPTGKTAA